jgi:hypothetical protein
MSQAEEFGPAVHLSAFLYIVNVQGWTELKARTISYLVCPIISEISALSKPSDTVPWQSVSKTKNVTQQMSTNLLEKRAHALLKLSSRNLISNGKVNV